MRSQPQTPAALYPWKDPIPIVQEAVWTSPPTGFDPRTIQPVGSHYIGRATRPGSILLWSHLQRNTSRYPSLFPVPNFPNIIMIILLLVFSPWAGLGRDQSSVRRLVWLWYAASWQVLRGSLPLLPPPFFSNVPTLHHQVLPRPPRRERSQRRK